MDLLKGPKGFISSAIAEALAEYFVISVDHIESNLLTDTKIVLKDARLKPQYSSISKNTFGRTTDICVTGFVREVSFTWSWDWLSCGSKSLIKDAFLQIEGCKFKVQMTQRDDNTTCNGHQLSSSELQSNADEQMAQTTSFEDGIYAYLTKQVELLVDALTLTIVDFEITVEMPSPTVLDVSTPISGVLVFEDPQEAGNIEIQLEASTTSSKSEASATGKNNVNNNYTVSLKAGVREFKILSNGRCCSNDDETLQEKISLSSLFVNVTETFHDTIDTTCDSPRGTVVCKTYPLQDPFSYTLGITRIQGKRFGDIGRGLIVKGGHHLQFDDGTATATTNIKDGGGLSFHLSRPQMEAVGQLSGLLLAPREETTKKENTPEITNICNNDDTISLVGGVSVFGVSFDTATVDMMGNTLVATGINFGCLADGTKIFAKLDTFSYVEVPSEAKQRGTSITFSDVVTSVRPHIEVTVGSVSKLYVPYVVELRTPMKNVQARLVGETWTVDIDSFEGYLPAPEVEVEGNRDRSSTKQLIPFPMSCKVKHICLVKEDDKETEVAFVDFEILINPKNNQSSTELACSVRSMNSKLACANNINAYMAIPSAERDAITILDFALSLDSISVTAGYTIQDWKKTFRIGGKWRRTRKKTGGQPTDFKLPHASVAPLKTRITYSAMRVVSVKETTFLVKSYKGKEDTTVKHLLDFYTAQCLARTPNFLQNAELLGINVNKAGAFSLGATLGIASPIGPFVGVAAVVGVDAVRGSIEAGKRSRHAKEGENAKVGDFFRGIGYSAVEATQKGKLRRGSEHGQGNVVDWMVGATVNTGDYIEKNKDTLGSAGGAGAGVLVGTILGGPVGAVIGGVVGGMTTGTAIRQIDKRIKKVIKKRDSKREENKLKARQLALSP